MSRVSCCVSKLHVLTDGGDGSVTMAIRDGEGPTEYWKVQDWYVVLPLIMAGIDWIQTEV